MKTYLLYLTHKAPPTNLQQTTISNFAAFFQKYQRRHDISWKCLLADNSHEISYLFFSKIVKDVAEFVFCCSCDWQSYRLLLMALCCESYELFYSIRLSLRKRSILGFTLGCVENNNYYGDFTLCIMGKIIHAYCLLQFFFSFFFKISFRSNPGSGLYWRTKESTSYRTSRTCQVRKLLHHDFSRNDSYLGRLRGFILITVTSSDD